MNASPFNPFLEFEPLSIPAAVFPFDDDNSTDVVKMSFTNRKDDDDR